MSAVVRKWPAWLLLLALLGCDGGPSGPSSASLQVTILGLPSGTPANVTITGPNNFSQSASTTQTFSQLTPGVYTVTAAVVTVGTLDYDPSPRSQSLSVGTTASQANASVFYSQATGNLTVNINGLGTSQSAVVNVAGPGGYSQMLDATTTLSGLDPGDYTITASDAAAIGCASHTASPATQTVTVVARTTVTATVDYSAPPNTGTVNLCIAGMYVTQSIQDIGGSVPLVQGRDGYLRVFVVADRANTVAPNVQVRLYNGGSLFSTLTILSSGFSVPTAIDESSLAYSWDTTLAGSIIQPGLAIEAEVNPGGVITETDPSDNVYPSTGPMLLNVQSVPTLDVTLVPVRQSGSLLVGRVTATNKDSFLVTTQRMHPIDTFSTVLHATYSTQTSLTLQANNSNGAWGTILGEIDALRIAEHSPRYYYGVARVTYSSGVAGVAYVSQSGTTPGSGQRAALGWDYLPSASVVAAHELGHNWGRNHAPCGGPAGIDPQYPRPDGTIGKYGMDVVEKTLEASTLTDVMGYCDPKWISDYTYRGVMSYLRAPSPPLLSVTSADIQPCLLVWGHIQNGEIILEPAFQIDTRPSLPRRRGAYSLQGLDTGGQSVFSLSFDPIAVVDAPGQQQNFVFALPLSSVAAARLASIRVTGQGRQASISDSATAVTRSNPVLMEAKRVANGRVALRWDRQTHPMVMVRDPDTGEVLSFARNGEAELATSKGEVDLLLSSGVRSQTRRVRVTP
jgi:Metallo-peptidase family M12B Reprolysin-like